jgi:hypothetical protein
MNVGRIANPFCKKGGNGMISVIFCSRVKDNPDSDVKRMLDSAVAHVRPDERDKIEFLIKYDGDDDQRPPDNRYPAVVMGEHDCKQS